MSYNLSRNTRVFFTTDVNSTTGIVNTGTAFTATNTYEIQVLDGYSFSQNVQADTVTLNEAGATPIRGQRSFNTSLDPVDWSISTYMRPATGVTAEERHLWAALAGSVNANTASVSLGTVGTTPVFAHATGTITLTVSTTTGLAVGDVVTLKGITAATAGALKEFNAPITITSITANTTIVGVYLTNPSSVASTLTASTGTTVTKSAWMDNTGNAIVHFGASDQHQLAKFGMIFIVDSTAYIIDNCAMDQLSIDFGLDSIATLAWSGKGTAMRQFANATTTTTSFTATGLQATNAFAAKNTAAPYIANKLSTMSLISNIGGVGGTTYNIALTGGNLTIANNLTYLTPANLSVVNTPVAYFTGTRSVTGNLTAYLRGISNGTSTLLGTMLTSSTTDISPSYLLEVAVGGATSTTRVELEMNNAVLQIPTVNIDQVVQAQINFTAQGYTPALQATAQDDLTVANELVVRYFV